MSETIRCFIAIELSPEIKAALQKIEDELRPNISGVKWVKPENIHLTLKFLGHIKPDTLESIKTTLRDVVSGTKPFAIRLSSASAFPSSFGSPRAIWIGVDRGDKESADLSDRIEEKTAALGIEKENRVFHPHLTLGRIDFLKDKYPLKNAFSSLKVPAVEMTASKLTLFQSTLTQGCPIYTILKEAKFSRVS